MTAKKYSTNKAEMFKAVIEVVKASDSPNKAEFIERLEHEIELVTKPRSGGKSEEKAKADKALSDKIIAVLANSDKGLTVSEIQAVDPALSVNAGINTSKVTALVTKLVIAGTLTKVKDKKKTLYTIAETAEPTED